MSLERCQAAKTAPQSRTVKDVCAVPSPALDLSLYVITDSSLTRGRPLIGLVEEAIRGGAACIQVREKKASARELYRLSRQLRILTRASNVTLIINDRLDVALAVEADGVHLGQDDLPAEAAKSLLPQGMLLGVSVENPRQARQAREAGASYLGVGAVFSTRTKPDAGEPIGLSALAEICSSTDLPVVGIGGIHAGNARAVIEAGASGVAVVSCLMAAEQVAAEARALAGQVRAALSSRQGRL